MSTYKRLEFNVKTGPNTPSLNLKISDPGELAADNLTLATWGSSQILADVLHTLRIPPAQSSSDSTTIPVLELGAGTGLVGLTAAAVWQTESILTDLAPILPGISANVALNEELLRDHGGSARCGMLDWSVPEELKIWSTESPRASATTSRKVFRASVNKARVILAADTVYSEEHPELLTRTIGSWLEPGRESRLVICYPLRIGYIDHIRDLWERFEDLGLEAIQEGREQIDASWDEDVPYEWSVWSWKAKS